MVDESELLSFEVFCPHCRCVDVNSEGPPTVSDIPVENGWYGQAHCTAIPMKCSNCQQRFGVTLETYKERAILTITKEVT